MRFWGLLVGMDCWSRRGRDALLMTLAAAVIAAAVVLAGEPLPGPVDGDVDTRIVLIEGGSVGCPFGWPADL